MFDNEKGKYKNDKKEKKNKNFYKPFICIRLIN